MNQLAVGEEIMLSRSAWTQRDTHELAAPRHTHVDGLVPNGGDLLSFGGFAATEIVTESLQK